jgi:hypothetical protein
MSIRPLISSEFFWTLIDDAGLVNTNAIGKLDLR